jgi:hypothetical protein
MSFDPEKFEKPDEPHLTMGEGYFLAFPKNNQPRVYYHPEADHWFADSPTGIMTRLSFDIEPGKIKNLISFGEGDIGFWYYLALLPKELRSTPVADEWINFILGPLAATLKVRGLGFSAREEVIFGGGLLVMFEAMALDLVPPGKRKALYEALIERFNLEYEANCPGESTARAIFYDILCDVLEPIFAEAGAGELTAMIIKVIEANPKQAVDAKTDPKVVGWIMGQVLRMSPTKLDPNTVRAAIIEQL